MFETLDPKAYALRPLRIRPKTDELILYTSTTFEPDPRAGIELLLRRMKVFGMLQGQPAKSPIDDLAVDVLDSEGDILQTFNLTPHGFEYLRAKLKFRVEKLDS